MKESHIFISIAFVIVIIAVGLCNFFYNDKFFDAPFYSLMSLVMAIVFSFIFTQSLNTQRKQKDYVDSSIDKIIFEVKSLNSSLLDNKFDYTEALHTKKQLSNRLYRVKDVCGKIELEKEADGAIDLFTKYETFIDDYLKSGEKYIGFKTRMDRDVANIINSLENLRVSLL